MSVPVIAFFNNKGGVGKTSLVYHLAWMYNELSTPTLAADLDPQANLTSAFLEPEELEELWPESGSHAGTIYGAVDPLLRGTGDISETFTPREVGDYLHLLPGDLALARFEDELSQQWPHCLDGKERAFRVESGLWRVIQRAAGAARAKLALIDVGPNLGALNRAALVACDYFVVPLAPDLFSLQGLQNLGPVVTQWRTGWQERRAKNSSEDLELPEGRMQPVGYVLHQHAVRLDRPTLAYDRWAARIPGTYARFLLGASETSAPSYRDDPNCLAYLKHFRSLMPMAQEARKPIFQLKPADGALGSHFYAAQQARREFEALARRISEVCGFSVGFGGSPSPA